MTETQNTALALLRSSLWGQSAPQIADLEAVKEELRHQACLTLTADVLGAMGDRASVREAANRLTHFYAMMEEQANMLALLEENGIRVVVLKGSAAAIYYPKPAYRKLGDIDLLIAPAQFDRALAVIREAGYEQYQDKERHMGFARGVARFEVHRHFSLEGNTSLDRCLFAAMERREQMALEGYGFPMLPPLENGIVLLSHLAQHLKGSAGVRQIVDWMLYCHTYLSDGYYEAVFAPAIRPLGLETLAVTATRLCQLHLGLGEDIHWCQGAQEELCEAILEQMLRKGMFGSKDPSSASTVSVLNMAKHPLEFMKQLQTMGCATWKALKKHPFLKPFAWFYQLCRFVRRGLARKNPFASLKADKAAADTQSALLHRLGLEP